MKLKWLVILVFAGVQTLTAGIVAVSTWAVVTSSVATNTADTTRAVADTVRLRYEQFVDPATDAVDLARFILQRHGPVDLSLATFERFMFNQLAGHPVVDALYMGRSTGEFMMVKRVQAPGPPTFLTKHIRVAEGDRTVEFHLRDRQFQLLQRWRDDDDPFDPRTRPWYRVAQERAQEQAQEKPQGDIQRWTDPYIFFTSGAPGVSTANALVGTSADSWGAVSVDIETGSFSRFLSSLALPGGGEAFIAGWDGEVVALPSEIGEAGQALFAEPEGSRRPALLHALLEADPEALAVAGHGKVLRDIQVGGQPYIVQLVGFAEAGMPWSIVIAVPEEAVFGWVYRLRNEIMAVSVAAGLLAALLLLLFWHRAIDRPMAVISARLAAIGAGGSGDGPPVNGLKEMRQIDQAVIAAGHLISDRQAARLMLIDQLGELVEAMERAPVGIAILEADRRLSFANGAARTALSAGEGQDVRLDPTALGMSEAEFAAKAELVVGGRTIRGEAVLPGAEGTEAEYRVLLSPLGEGDDTRILLVLEDVSTANVLEAGLAEALEAAERSDQAKTLFLAQMSHEFRTPLNAIAGFSEMLQGAPDMSSDKARQYVGHISASAATLLDMVDRILEYVRYESGAVVMVPRATDVAGALEGAIAAVNHEAAAAGMTVELALHGPLEPVAADPAMLTRALEQLLSNAIKFSSPGSVVSVAAAPGPGGESRYITVGVVDRGSGIAVGDLPRVFDPFWKADSHLRSSAEGPGLGLAIARRIITGFGGQIEMDSAPGEGTRVVATLPVFSGSGSDGSNDT